MPVIPRRNLTQRREGWVKSCEANLSRMDQVMVVIVLVLALDLVEREVGPVGVT